MIHEFVSRDREDDLATGQPQGLGAEAYLNGTSQGSRSEDAPKEGHIIRARYAPLSPASGFPVSRSEQLIRELSGLNLYFRYLDDVLVFLQGLKHGRANRMVDSN